MYLINKGHEDTIHGWYDSLNISMNEGSKTLFVAFPHTFFAAWFKQSWQEVFDLHARNAFSVETILYTVQKKTDKEPQVPLYSNTVPQNTVPQNTVASAQINQNATFETFISNTKHAYILKYLTMLCEKNAKSSYLTLMHGASGFGKTHLLHAMAHYMQQQSINYTLYDTPEQFLDNVDTFISSNIISYIFIDNMHTIKENHQEKMCQMIDIFSKKNIYCVVAGTDSPNIWPLQSTLRSRFSDAIWLVLPSPDLDIRLQYTHTWCSKHALHISKEHSIFIAQACQNIRKLSGILQQLILQEEFLAHQLTTTDIENILQNNETKTLNPQDIIAQVAHYYTLQPQEILQEKRDPKRVQARYIAMFLCRELLGHSYPSIGRSFAGKDHSTVMYGIRKIKQLQLSNKDIDNDIQQLTKQCLRKNI